MDLCHIKGIVRILFIVITIPLYLPTQFNKLTVRNNQSNERKTNNKYFIANNSITSSVLCVKFIVIYLYTTCFFNVYCIDVLALDEMVKKEKNTKNN